MTRRSGLSILLTLIFLLAGPASALAHPYPAPHSHKLTQGDSQVERTHKKHTEDVKRPSQQKPKIKAIPKANSTEQKKSPSKSKSTQHAKEPSI